jgi:5-methylcytosine-specific restriction enzyme A
MKVSNDLAPIAYKLAKDVYYNRLTLTEARDRLVEEYGMNSNSAVDYILSFRHFLKGERYTRTNNAYAAEYFINAIYNDYGSTGLKNALKALKLHIEYYEDLQKITMHKQKKILDKFTKLLADYPDEEEQSEIIQNFKQQKKSKQDIAHELSQLKPSDPVLITINGKVYKRDNRTIALIKILRDFKCQICKCQIIKKDGTPYIEAAHIKPKHQKGNETLDNILILCPNHHKEFDLGDLIILQQSNESIHFRLNNKEHRLKIGAQL